MLFKFKDAFSLRDEKGTYPNIVEIDGTDKHLFFTRSCERKRLSYIRQRKGKIMLHYVS